MPDFNVLNPSYLAYAIPIIAVDNINIRVLNAPICDPILINKYISIKGIPIIANNSVFICLYLITLLKFINIVNIIIL